MDIARMKAELRRDEGERLKPYRDTVGKLTIGVGRNLDDVGITAAEADVLLETDIAAAAAGLDRALPWWRGLSEVRRRALLNMAFNLGVPRLLGFSEMCAALARGDFAQAADAALDSLWARQVGARAGRIARMIREG
ncbi:Lysozyme [uncultured Alphaproteobacteria bacterium]|uniref:Lysozyme n=1 Tax=uncultured Alphaproteobacteria bacterium TaxID=91750 RepID=A0A212JE49_9PROT|nr:Lysozyme [uncultured Alphaproteobacteria bacterium]